MLLGSEEPGCTPVGFHEELKSAEVYFLSRRMFAENHQEEIAQLSAIMEELRIAFLFLDFTSEEVCEASSVEEDETSSIIRDAEMAILTGNNLDAYCAYKAAERLIKALYLRAQEAACEARCLPMLKEWRKETLALLEWTPKSEVEESRHFVQV